MKTGIIQMKCGGCGGEDHKVFTQTRGESDVILECNNCKSQTIIRASTPRLILDWGSDDQKGRLCPMGNWQ